MSETLGTYEGRDVIKATVAIRNTGDGLSEAMAVDPVKLSLGATVHVVLECTVEKHRYDPVKDTGRLQLVNMLKAGRATIVADDHLAGLVAATLNEQQERIAAAVEDPGLFEGKTAEPETDEEWEASGR